MLTKQETMIASYKGLKWLADYKDHKMQESLSAQNKRLGETVEQWRKRLAEAHKWTRATYDALHAWVMGGDHKAHSRCVLLACGLGDVVAELDAADNLGVWYALTRAASDAVGSAIVAASARQAEYELDAMTA